MNARKGFCAAGILSARVCTSLNLTYVHASFGSAIILPGMQPYGQYISLMHLKVGVEETVCEILHARNKLYAIGTQACNRMVIMLTDVRGSLA